METPAGYVTPKHVSAAIGVSGTQIRNHIKNGHIQAIQPGGRRGRYLIPASEIERLMRPVAPEPERAK